MAQNCKHAYLSDLGRSMLFFVLPSTVLYPGIEIARSCALLRGPSRSFDLCLRHECTPSLSNKRYFGYKTQ